MTSTIEVPQEDAAPPEVVERRFSGSHICMAVCLLIVAVGLVQGFDLYSWFVGVLPTALPERIGVLAGIAVALGAGAVVIYDRELALNLVALAIALGIVGFFTYVAVSGWFHLFQGTPHPFSPPYDHARITPFGGIVTIAGLSLLAFCIGRVEQRWYARVGFTLMLAVAFNMFAVMIIMLVHSVANFDPSRYAPVAPVEKPAVVATDKQ